MNAAQRFTRGVTAFQRALDAHGVGVAVPPLVSSPRDLLRRERTSSGTVVVASPEAGSPASVTTVTPALLLDLLIASRRSPLGLRVHGGDSDGTAAVHGVPLPGTPKGTDAASASFAVACARVAQRQADPSAQDTAAIFALLETSLAVHTSWQHSLALASWSLQFARQRLPSAHFNQPWLAWDGDSAAAKADVAAVRQWFGFRCASAVRWLLRAGAGNQLALATLASPAVTQVPIPPRGLAALEPFRSPCFVSLPRKSLSAENEIDAAAAAAFRAAQLSLTVARHSVSGQLYRGVQPGDLPQSPSAAVIEATQADPLCGAFSAALDVSLHAWGRTAVLSGTEVSFPSRGAGRFGGSAPGAISQLLSRGHWAAALARFSKTPLYTWPAVAAVVGSALAAPTSPAAVDVLREVWRRGPQKTVSGSDVQALYAGGRIAARVALLDILRLLAHRHRGVAARVNAVFAPEPGTTNTAALGTWIEALAAAGAPPAAILTAGVGQQLYPTAFEAVRAAAAAVSSAERASLAQGSQSVSACPRHGSSAVVYLCDVPPELLASDRTAAYGAAVLEPIPKAAQLGRTPAGLTVCALCCRSTQRGRDGSDAVSWDAVAPAAVIDCAVGPVAVVQKAAGIPPCVSKDTSSIVDALREQCPEADLVNRLDRGTSGLCLAATSSKAAATLRATIVEDRSLRKEYFAVVLAVARTAALRWRALPQGTISAMIDVDGRRGQGRLKRASLRYAVVETFTSQAGTVTSLLRLSMPSGHRHHIRQVCAANDFPLLGDTFYAPAAASRLVVAASGGSHSPRQDRFMLHAASVTLPRSASGARHTTRIDAAMPTDMVAVINALRAGRDPTD